MNKNTKIKIEGIPEGFTERVHNGSYSDWRKPGQSWHDSKFSLKAPEQGLKSGLIDGEWFWVCGCSKCFGTEESFCYWVCDKHNICETCGIHRSKLNEPPWGTRNGFRCKDCQSIIVSKNLN